jgi:iron complex outermembrane receptor protein
MSGVDVALHYHPHFAHRVHIESNYSLIYTETDSGRSLPLMPQNRLSNTVRFSLGMKSIVQLEDVLLQYILHFGQYRTAEFETSSSPYHLIHLSLNGRLAFKEHPIGFKIGVKNVLNSSYIDHLSRLKNIGMEHPGRNFFISISYQFNQPLKSIK